MVDGSVRKLGGRVCISAQLIDVKSGHHLRSETLDRPRDDLFEVQDEIVGTVVLGITPKA